MEACGGDVEVELADGDAHAVHAQVSEPEDSRPIGHHDSVHLKIKRHRRCEVEDFVETSDCKLPVILRMLPPVIGAIDLAI